MQCLLVKTTYFIAPTKLIIPRFKCSNRDQGIVRKGHPIIPKGVFFHCCALPLSDEEGRRMGLNVIANVLQWGLAASLTDSLLASLRRKRFSVTHTTKELKRCRRWRGFGVTDEINNWGWEVASDKKGSLKCFNLVRFYKGFLCVGDQSPVDFVDKNKQEGY